MTWQRLADACDIGNQDNLAIAPSGALMRWSTGAPATVPQVLDGFP